MATEANNTHTSTFYASSQCVVHSGSLVWDIEKFLLFNTPGKSYSSPEFRAGDTKWKLNCFAAGELGELNQPTNFLGLYLHSMNDRTLTCTYSVTLFIGDTKLEDIHKISDCDEFGKNDNWGWGQLCPLETLRHLMQDCSTLRMLCSLQVFVKRQNVVSGRPAGDPQGLSTICTSTSMTKHFEQMLETGLYSDVMFICKGEKIPAHKSVLSSRSPVFKTMFQSGMSEAKDGIVTVMECEVDVFKMLLNFVYTGTIKQEALSSNVEELLAVADKYDVEDLKVLCDKVLLAQLTPQNAASLLSLADTFHCVTLKQSVLNLAVMNFEAVLLSADFVALCKNNPHLVAELNIARAEYTKEFNQQSKKKKPSRSNGGDM